MRTSTLSGAKWLHSAYFPFFIITLLTGIYVGLAPFLYDNPLLSPVFFITTFLLFVLAAWYVWFTDHRTRWIILLIAVTGFLSFANLYFTEINRCSRTFDTYGPQKIEGHFIRNSS